MVEKKTGSSSSLDHNHTHSLHVISNHSSTEDPVYVEEKGRVIKCRQIDGQMAGGVDGHVGEYRDCCLLCARKAQCPSRREKNWEILHSATHQIE